MFLSCRLQKLSRVALAFFCVLGVAEIFNPGPSWAQASHVSTSEVLDNVRIPDHDGDGNDINQISGLAYDEDEQVLYAVSDYGHIIHFKVDIADGKIKSLMPVFYGPLELKGDDATYSDAEGITVINGSNGIKGDSEIIVVFEDGPASAKFNPAGKLLERIVLPPALADPAAYREANQRVEAVAFSPHFGVLFAPQVPLIGQKKKVHTVYAADGKTWSFTALQPKQTNTKDMQILPDGTLLLLEGVNLGGMLSWFDMGTHELHLRQLDLGNCKREEPCPVTEYTPTDLLAMQDRFEGLTRFSENLYLLATDENNGSRLALVQTKP